MQGVILAAGKGTRLHPITATRTKAMAPVAGKPIVARVLDTDLTYDQFCTTLVQHVLPDLLTSRHGPRAVLDEMAEELMVLTRCRDLGIDVGQDELLKKENELDREIRTRSGGRQRLADIIKEQGQSVAEFRAGLLHELRKDHLANHRLGGTLPDDEHQRHNQIKLVIAKMLGEANLVYGLPVEEQPNPPQLAEGVVATVDGHPISRLQFGRQLAVRLPSDEVREYLGRECQIGLMARRGATLDDAALREELGRMRKLWDVERLVQREVEWETVGFDDRFRALFKLPVTDAPGSRFHRGLFGLVRQMRGSVTEPETRQEYQDGLANRFGPHVIATDIKIGFEQERNPFRRQGGATRTRREAVDLAHRVVSQVSANVPFDRVVASIRARRTDQGQPDPTFTATRIRVFQDKDEGGLWNDVKDLADGELSAPIERLAEIHVVRREQPGSGHTYDELGELLVDYVARQKARQWLDESLRDPNRVRVRWPMPAP